MRSSTVSVLAAAVVFWFGGVGGSVAENWCRDLLQRSVAGYLKARAPPGRARDTVAVFVVVVVVVVPHLNSSFWDSHFNKTLLFTMLFGMLQPASNVAV